MMALSIKLAVVGLLCVVAGCSFAAKPSVEGRWRESDCIQSQDCIRLLSQAEHAVRTQGYRPESVEHKKLGFSGSVNRQKRTNFELNARKGY